jgi:hypothetical protein
VGAANNSYLVNKTHVTIELKIIRDHKRYVRILFSLCGSSERSKYISHTLQAYCNTIKLICIAFAPKLTLALLLSQRNSLSCGVHNRIYCFTYTQIHTHTHTHTHTQTHAYAYTCVTSIRSRVHRLEVRGGNGGACASKAFMTCPYAKDHRPGYYIFRKQCNITLIVK